MPPKILFILHLPPPIHGAAMVGKYIQDSKVINENFDCRYINLSTSKNLQEIGKVGIGKLTGYCKLLWHIYQTVKKEKPDLCYVTPSAYKLGFYKEFITVMLLKAMRMEVVVHYHNQGFAKWSNNFPHSLFCRIFFRKTQVILLASELYRDIQKYVKKEDVFICPNGIANIETDCYRNKKGHDFNILFLSNMMEDKGVWDLVEACNIIQNSDLNFKCDFVGKWSDIDEITFNDKVRIYNLIHCIKAHGAKYNEDKQPFFTNADCFVLPTHNECFPLVLLEAMQQGIACISTNEGGIPNIIENGKTGYIVNKHSPQELAEKITLLINNPELCQSMGEAGRKKFEKEFTIEQFEKRFVEILSTIIQS